MKPDHWAIQGKVIVARVRVANAWSVIASVENERSVRQMLRYAALGEQVEHVMDRFVGGEFSDGDALRSIRRLVGEAIQDTTAHGKVNAPEMQDPEGKNNGG